MYTEIYNALIDIIRGCGSVKAQPNEKDDLFNTAFTQIGFLLSNGKPCMNCVHIIETNKFCDNIVLVNYDNSEMDIEFPKYMLVKGAPSRIVGINSEHFKYYVNPNAKDFRIGRLVFLITDICNIILQSDHKDNAVVEAYYYAILVLSVAIVDELNRHSEAWGLDTPKCWEEELAAYLQAAYNSEPARTCITEETIKQTRDFIKQCGISMILDNNMITVTDQLEALDERFHFNKIKFVSVYNEMKANESQEETPEEEPDSYPKEEFRFKEDKKEKHYGTVDNIKEDKNDQTD